MSKESRAELGRLHRCVGANDDQANASAVRSWDIGADVATMVLLLDDEDGPGSDMTGRGEGAGVGGGIILGQVAVEEDVRL